MKSSKKPGPGHRGAPPVPQPQPRPAAVPRRRSAGAAATPASASAVDALRHKDKRVNIPTEELREFARKDETKPKTILYPRDPSLDPQLVWKGKDEQDSKDLAVPAVPVYIQEKIHPQAHREPSRHRQPGEREPEMKPWTQRYREFDKKVDSTSTAAGPTA